MAINNVEDCQSFQDDLDRLQKLCLRNKFDFNVNKCRTITFSRLKNPIKHDNRIGGHGFERVEEFKDLGVFMNRCFYDFKKWRF
jgi:hypothetical protein